MRKYIFRNKRNENKYIEVRVYKDGHRTMNPYMEWSNGVRNYLGATLRQKKGYARRVRKETLAWILVDYTLIWNSEEVAA